jgi:soluble lytic murein transglycosylase-like protein
MKRLTVAAAALAAGMLTIVAQSQAESDKTMSHKPAGKVAAIDWKAEKVAAADRKAEKLAAADRRAEKLAAARRKAEQIAAADRKAEKIAAADRKAEKVAAADRKAEKPVAQAVAAKSAKRVAGLAKPRTVRTGKHKAKDLGVDAQKTASIARVRPALKATARKSMKGFDSIPAGNSVASAATYTTIVSRYAAAYGVPVSLAHAVISVESNYRPNIRGSAGEIGLMQIKPATARMMGYTGNTKGLFNPETNIKYGMKYLGLAHQLSGGTTCGTILRYNAGHAAKRMNPVSAAYCSKVKLRLAGSFDKV